MNRYMHAIACHDHNDHEVIYLTITDDGDENKAIKQVLDFHNSRWDEISGYPYETSQFPVPHDFAFEVDKDDPDFEDSSRTRYILWFS